MYFHSIAFNYVTFFSTLFTVAKFDWRDVFASECSSEILTKLVFKTWNVSFVMRLYFFSRDEVSLLHVFFKSEFIVQYKRDQLYGIEDLVCKSGFAILHIKVAKDSLKSLKNCFLLTLSMHSLIKLNPNCLRYTEDRNN